MKISVITVTYNSAKTIRDTIESVIKQNHPDVEFLIIDGASKDDTIKIAESYGDKITKIISEPDNGIFDAMNKGIRNATGDVIAILNSDDFYTDENVLSEVAKKFTQEPELGCVYGDLYYVDQDDTSKIKRVWKSKPYKKGLFKTGWMPAHPTFFVRKEIYEQHGAFYDDRTLWVAADYEIMLRFIVKHETPVGYIPKFLVKMRDGGNSNKSLKNIIAGNKEVLKAWKLNGLPVPYWIFITKPLSKIFQLLKAKKTN